MTKEFDKRNAAKSRKVCEAMAEAASTGKRVLTEREREILDMWPRFEDSEPVMAGDVFQDCKGDNRAVCGIEFYPHRFWLVDDGGWHVGFGIGERVKRPVQSVLDADGVEIKVGDTVWHRSLCTMGSMRKATVIGFDENCLGGKLATLKDEAGKTWYICPEKITHVQPDSWEQLESDAALPPGDYVDKRGRRTDLYAYQEMPMDLIRRAKALAGVEVGR